MLWFIIIGGYFIGFLICFFFLYINPFEWDCFPFDDSEEEFWFSLNFSIFFWWFVLSILIIISPFALFAKLLLFFLENLPKIIKRINKYKDIKFYKEK